MVSCLPRAAQPASQELSPLLRFRVPWGRRCRKARRTALAAVRLCLCRECCKCAASHVSRPVEIPDAPLQHALSSAELGRDHEFDVAIAPLAGAGSRRGGSCLHYRRLHVANKHSRDFTLRRPTQALAWRTSRIAWLASSARGLAERRSGPARAACGRAAVPVCPRVQVTDPPVGIFSSCGNMSRLLRDAGGRRCQRTTAGVPPGFASPSMRPRRAARCREGCTAEAFSRLVEKSVVLLLVQQARREMAPCACHGGGEMSPRVPCRLPLQSRPTGLHSTARALSNSWRRSRGRWRPSSAATRGHARA